MTIQVKLVCDNSTHYHICTKNSVKIECVIIVIGLVSLEVLLMKLQFKIQGSKVFPFVFINMSGYDSHLFIKTLGNSEGDISCIPNNEENYISFTNMSSLTHLLIRKEKRSM